MLKKKQKKTMEFLKDNTGEKKLQVREISWIAYAGLKTWKLEYSDFFAIITL